MSNSPLLTRVKAALAAVKNPETGKSVIDEGRVIGLTLDNQGVVRFALEAVAGSREASEALLESAKSAVADVAGVTHISAVATAHTQSSRPPNKPESGHANPFGLKKQSRIDADQQMMPQVKQIIAIASGKGGVGKSTIAANLAVALSRQGLKVGLLDADIYGPSLPTLFGLKTKAMVRGEKILPMQAFGVSAMSIGLLVDPKQALAWRGPMVMGALRQLMNDVDWGALDILLVDTPPGTGDVHLTLIQTKRLSGAVIVSTPQEMALADMRRGVELFRKTETPVLGIIENMAWLETSDGSRQYIFGRGGAERAAADLCVPFFGAVPLYPALREASDRGEPVSSGCPESEAFDVLAEKIVASLTPPL